MKGNLKAAQENLKQVESQPGVDATAVGNARNAVTKAENEKFVGYLEAFAQNQGLRDKLMKALLALALEPQIKKASHRLYTSREDEMNKVLDQGGGEGGPQARPRVCRTVGGPGP